MRTHLTYGRAIDDRRWFATAGKPNSPPLDVLIAAVDERLGDVDDALSSTVVLTDLLDSPSVLVTPADTRKTIAGGGGAALTVLM